MDDAPRAGLPALRRQLPDGGGAWDAVWLSASAAAQAYGAERPAVFDGCSLGLAVSWICGLWGGPTAGVFSGTADGRGGDGHDRWQVPEARFYLVLAGCQSGNPPAIAPRKKIFAFFKNFICIWGKMGYNMGE